MAYAQKLAEAPDSEIARLLDEATDAPLGGDGRHDGDAATASRELADAHEAFANTLEGDKK